MRSFKAWLIGNIMIIAFYAMYYIFSVFFTTIEYFLAIFIWFIFPAIAAFATSYLACNHKIILGISISFANIVYITIIELFCIMFDIGDNIGVEGILMLILTNLLINIIICSFAAIFANFVSKNGNKSAMCELEG
jgi:hypothetical protein